MAEQKQPLVFALGRGYNGFYCPETRFHLVGGLKPQAVYSAAKLSEDVKRALRGGTIVDVNNLLTEEDIKPNKGTVAAVTSSDRKKAILIQAEEMAKEERAADKKSGEEKDDYIAPDFKGQKEQLISEPDILSFDKKELLKFIEDHEELSLEELELNSRSTKDDIQKALMTKLGYNEKPVDHKEK